MEDLKRKDAANNMLLQIVSAEYEHFLKRLELLSPQQIIEKSYEKVIKEDLVLSIENEPVTEKQAKALMKLDMPLDSMYQHWLKTDVTYMDRLSECIDDCANREAERGVRFKKEKEHER